jgi:thiol:disulfide interchange protein DsbA
MLNRFVALFAAATLSGAVFASPSPLAATSYVTLEMPQAVNTGKKIELIEFFWYRCPHCYDLEPALNAWLKKLPKDVQLKRVPAVFRDDWLPAAKLYYALQDVGAENLHDAVFDAYHLDNLDLDNPTVLMDWIAKKGVDRAKFEASYQSFSTQSKAMRGGMIAREYTLKGVPSFAIDGKYVTSESMTGSRPALFATLDQLIAKVRKARATGKVARKK